MSDPNMDAANAHCNSKADAWLDFMAWWDARHPERGDTEGLAEEYTQDCANGAWPVSQKEGE